MKKILGILSTSKGQMSVEVAVLMPVTIVVALIIYNLSCFIAACARFDRISSGAVIAYGVSPEGTVSAVEERICSAIAEAMGEYDRIEIQVSKEQASNVCDTSFTMSPLLTRYNCTLYYAIWPGPFSIGGVSLSPPAALVHKQTLVIDQFKPGVVS